MKAHYIQHEPFEDLAALEPWLMARGVHISSTRTYGSENLPVLDTIDLLIVLGGGMGANDDKIYPWMKPEKVLIERALKKGKKVLGICLGAQLMADVLGARVSRNREKEIGWHPVDLAPGHEASRIFSAMPRTFTPFHWHGDTFDIPAGAVRTAASAACDNQAFDYGGHAVGLQFHLETLAGSVENLITNCPEDIQNGPYIQKAEGMRFETQSRIEAITPVLNLFLERFLDITKKP